jgi:hypothetical protein
MHPAKVASLRVAALNGAARSGEWYFDMLAHFLKCPKFPFRTYGAHHCERGVESVLNYLSLNPGTTKAGFLPAASVLDVLSMEPPPAGNPLLTVRNCLVAPYADHAKAQDNGAPGVCDVKVRQQGILHHIAAGCKRTAIGAGGLPVAGGWPIANRPQVANLPHNEIMG